MIRISSISRSDAPLKIEAVEDTGVRPQRRPHTVLIIEDDPTMRLALACLVADNNIQVVLASSAEDALERLSLIEPDLVLCDYILGGMTGREFCQHIRRDARWWHLPLLMVTRLDDPGVAGDLLRSGADDVITKPVKGEPLRARVQAGLRRSAAFNAAIGAAR